MQTRARNENRSILKYSINKEIEADFQILFEKYFFSGLPSVWSFGVCFHVRGLCPLNKPDTWVFLGVSVDGSVRKHFRLAMIPHQFQLCTGWSSGRISCGRRWTGAFLSFVNLSWFPSWTRKLLRFRLGRPQSFTELFYLERIRWYEDRGRVRPLLQTLQGAGSFSRSRPVMNGRRVLVNQPSNTRSSLLPIASEQVRRIHGFCLGSASRIRGVLLSSS